MAAEEWNAGEIAAWNGPLGRTWTQWQAAFDDVLEPFAKLALDRAAVRPGERAVDIGCGAGATTIALGGLVGPDGHVLGIDVSAPMLARARERLPRDLPVTFLEADASTYAFSQGTFDLLFSRFGVMFFAEPHRAFANLRLALRTGGRLAFVCYRDRRENPLLMTALHAAYEHVPPLPKAAPEAPSPFAFADEARVRDILTTAGFQSIRCEPVDLEIDIARGRGLDEAVNIGLELGPVARAIAEHPAELRDAVAQSVRRAYAPFQRGSSVPLGAAVWVVTAASP